MNLLCLCFPIYFSLLSLHNPPFYITQDNIHLFSQSNFHFAIFQHLPIRCNRVKTHKKKIKNSESYRIRRSFPSKNAPDLPYANVKFSDFCL